MQSAVILRSTSGGQLLRTLAYRSLQARTPSSALPAAADSTLDAATSIMCASVPRSVLVLAWEVWS